MFKDLKKSINDSFYMTPIWRRTRKAYRKHREAIDGGMCERCRVHPGAIVHHRVHLTPDTINDPDIAYGFGNLELVCLDCHNEEHGLKGKRPPGMTRYDFDAAGNPVPRPSPSKF